ncbi:unnamed protein product [Linum trigynum]|uniref:Uncharacterized protein n=1 Tax=Linum trigynum TaxID=586398 RepID=A0AAV2D849_9ROSI
MKGFSKYSLEGSNFKILQALLCTRAWEAEYQPSVKAAVLFIHQHSPVLRAGKLKSWGVRNIFTAFPYGFRFLRLCSSSDGNSLNCDFSEKTKVNYGLGFLLHVGKISGLAISRRLQ